MREYLRRELGEYRSDVARADAYRAGHINGVDTVREVGIYEKHGKLDGQWLDVVIVERLIPANLT